jgi:hypothetical protein
MLRRGASEAVEFASSTERLFPTLKPEQVERAALHGRVLFAQDREVLVELGASNIHFSGPSGIGPDALYIS